MSEVANNNESVMSTKQAQQEFRQLAESQRARALWHLRPTLAVDILSSEADGILRSIALHGTLETWLRAKGLMRWRSQHSK